MNRSSNAALALATHADRSGWSSRPAYLVNDHVWTHGQIHDLAARVTGVLHEHGVRPGDHVLLAAPDGAAWVVALFAVVRRSVARDALLMPLSDTIETATMASAAITTIAPILVRMLRSTSLCGIEPLLGCGLRAFRGQ